MGTLRIMLAISVIACHSSAILGSVLIPGNYAVEIFFIISGFYMALILSTKYVGKDGALLFYQNRFLRLYPAYLCISLLGWVWFFFAWLWLRKMPANGWYEAYRTMLLIPKCLLIASNWTMVGLDLPSLVRYVPLHGFVFTDGAHAVSEIKNYWGGDFRTIGQAWSIGAEIWFYLMAPWVVRLKTVHVLCGLAASAGLKLYLELQAGVSTYFIFPSQVCWFLTGVLLYRFYHSAYFKPLTRPMFRTVLSAIVVGLIVYPWVASPFKVLVLFSLVGISIPYMFHATRQSVWEQHLGNLSYPIYLSHMLVLFILNTTVRVHSGTVAAFLTILLSVGIYKFIESPIDKYRQSRIKHQKTGSCRPASRAIGIPHEAACDSKFQ